MSYFGRRPSLGDNGSCSATGMHLAEGEWEP